MKNSKFFRTSTAYRNLFDKIHQTLLEESEHEENKDFIAAIEAGLKAWNYLKEFMNLLEVKSLCELEYETAYDLLYWACRLSDHLHNASINDASFLEKKFLFCKEYVEMHQDFLDKEMRNIANIRRSLADCYVAMGDFKTCDDLYETWLQREPDWGWGWICWSDVYWFYQKKHKPNYIKALSILERGLSMKSVNDKNHIIDRFDSIQEALRA